MTLIDISNNGEDFINFDEFQQNVNSGDVSSQDLTSQLTSTIVSNIPEKTSRICHVCGTCGKSFTRKSNLNSHLKLHAGEKSHVCYVCQKAFPRNSHLTRHMEVHAKVKKLHKCEECERQFTRKSDLIKHMRMIHSLKKKKIHICEQCESHFARKSDLIKHMRTTHSLKMKNVHICEQCESQFAKKSDLIKHMRTTHSFKKKKVHVCEQCESQFAKKSDLIKHMRTTHSLKKKKVHICEQCESQFVRKSDLFKHVRANHPFKGKTIRKAVISIPTVKTFKYESSALGVFYSSYFEPSEEARGDFLIFFSEARPEVLYKLITRLEEKKGIKWYAVVNVVLSRTAPDGEIEYITPHFRSNVYIGLIPETIQSNMNEALVKIINSFEAFTQRGSGWTLDKIKHLELNCCTYRPLTST